MEFNNKFAEIKELFNEIIDLGPTEREKYLEKLDTTFNSLRSEVEALLKAHAQAPSALEKPVFEIKSLPAFEIDYSGKSIGAYRILETIGKGGMGQVFLAERADGQYEKKVALKLIRHGLDSAELVKRFLNERQVLATLNHPGIARFLEGGITDDGQPYFAMDFIEGSPIDQFCDEKKLSTTQRLQLFLKVCSAVQYLHRNLIVHRDLKPANILVNSEGNPVLLDFGIVKLLNPQLIKPDQTLTQTGIWLLTPEYASPEQVRGEAITVASDVYSLGVLLYKLLTGHRPYQFKSRLPNEIEKVICEVEPEKPGTIIKKIVEQTDADGSTKPLLSPEIVSEPREGSPEKLRRRLTGDLDVITLKALNKESQQRYSSVEQFSADIQHHLDGTPVLAQKATFLYKTGKFLKKYKLPAAATIIVFLSLLTGIIGISWQARIANTQKNIALKAANSMIYELAEGLRTMSGPTESRIGLLNQAAQTFNEIAKTGSSDQELDFSIADVNRYLSKTYLSLGEHKKALDYIQKAEHKARLLLSQTGGALKIKEILAKILIGAGDVYRNRGQEDEAEKANAEALVLFREVIPHPEIHDETRRYLGRLLIRTGDRNYYKYQLDQAEMDYRESYRIFQALVLKDSTHVGDLAELAIGIERLGDILYEKGKVDTCCVVYRQALKIRRKTVQIAPENVEFQSMLANTIGYVGWCDEQEPNLDAALAHYDESISILRQIYSTDPLNTHYIKSLIGMLGTKGNLLNSAGKFNQAIIIFNEIIALWEDLRKNDKSNTSINFKIVSIAEMLSISYIGIQQYQQAYKSLNLSMELIEELIEQDSDNSDYQESLANIFVSKGDLLVTLNKPDEAVVLTKRALEKYNNLLKNAGSSLLKQRQANAYLKYGKALRAVSRPGAAKEVYLKGKKILMALRKNGELSDTSEGYRIYLPKIEKALADL